MDRPVNDDAAVERIVRMFETFTVADVAKLDGFYTPDAFFKDPFNEVRGLPAIRRIYAHMFEALEAPRFVVTASVAQGSQCFLAWEFRFRFKSWRREQEQVVRGGSHLLLAPEGRIASHRDYWDAAEEVYAKLPGIGGVVRWLRRKGSAG
jgi:steroid delta-isomerase